MPDIVTRVAHHAQVGLDESDVHERVRTDFEGGPSCPLSYEVRTFEQPGDPMQVGLEATLSCRMLPSGRHPITVLVAVNTQSSGYIHKSRFLLQPFSARVTAAPMVSDVRPLGTCAAKFPNMRPSNGPGPRCLLRVSANH